MVAILYAVMLASVIMICLILPTNPQLAGYAILLICTSVIGVHGIFSGTATADFAGTRNSGAAVGIVDGMVYLGTGLQAMVIGQIVPQGPSAEVPGNWGWWPVFLLPFTVIGSFLALRIWNAKPQAKTPAASHGTWEGRVGSDRYTS